MIPPEVIERMKRERREREERDRPALRLPLSPPDDAHRDRRIHEEESTNASSVIVIEMA